jgi:hypothetical protein
MIKLKRRWTGHVTHIEGEEDCIYNFDEKVRRKGTTRKIEA